MSDMEAADVRRQTAIRQRLHKLWLQVQDPWHVFAFSAWNISIAACQMLFGLLAFHFSAPQIQQYSPVMTIFPLSFPHAISLAAFCWRKFYFTLGVFTGFYGNRLYYLVHGVQKATAFRYAVLFVVVLLRTGGVCTAGTIIRKLICTSDKKIPTIDTLADAASFILTVLITMLATETIITAVEHFGRMLPLDYFAIHLASWWLAAVVAMVTVTPFLVHAVAWKPWRTLTTLAKILEVSAVSVILLLSLVLIFVLDIMTAFRPLPYLIYPLLIYGCFRYNRVGWALILVTCCFICSWSTLLGRGAFFRITGSHLRPRLVVEVEMFTLVFSGVCIALAASLSETIHLFKKLEKLNEGLETLISRRTEQLVITNEELEESRKAAELANAAKSEFLRTVSHEIRTPIHGIMGMAEIVSVTALSDLQKKSVTAINDCAEILLQIMNNVFEIAEIECAHRCEWKVSRFNLQQVLDSTMHILEPSTRVVPVHLTWDIDPSVPEWILGDSGKVRQCLLNTVANGLHSTRKGCVRVQVSLQEDAIRRDQDLAFVLSKLNWPALLEGVSQITPTRYVLVPSPIVEVPLLRRKPKDARELPLLFKISDSRKAMGKEKLQRLLSLQDRTHANVGCFSSVVQRSVELLGGQLLVDSERDRGTVVYIMLPFFVEPVTTDTDKNSRPYSIALPPEGNVGVRIDAPRPSSMRILLVEDNVVNQKVATRLLQKSGHAVTVAQDGLEAVTVVQSQADAFDVVLMDIQMPKMDGIEATKCIRYDEARTGRKKVPIIGTSAHGGEPEAFISAGMDDYVPKPFEVDKLLATIHRLFSKQ